MPGVGLQITLRLHRSTYTFWIYALVHCDPRSNAALASLVFPRLWYDIARIKSLELVSSVIAARVARQA